MIAVGVASPSAHGHAIVNTETNTLMTNALSSPTAAHTIAASTAIAMTDGTKTLLTLSASLAMGALLFCALSTSLIILLSIVSAPTDVARNLSVPSPFTVPPITRSPTVLSTGKLSPVSILSCTALSPSMTSPSQQKLSPALTSTMSPATTSCASTLTNSPPLSTVASFGASMVNLEIASPVLASARCSRYFPSEISASITAADSK